MSIVSKKLKSKLTVAEKRLNHSSECQNCGTALQGAYCHFCGQPDKNFFRFFPALFREMMGDLLDLDSRITRTLKPLLFQPGKLADDYMHGRRFRYTSPVRLYLFSSIIFFLLIGFITNFEIQHGFDSHKNASQENVATVPPHDSPLTQSDTDPGGDKDETAEESPAEKTTDLSISSDEGSSISIDLNAGLDTVDIPLMPQILNDWINAELEKSDAKSKAIEEDPTIIADKIFELLPMTVFILLPVFALILKAFYILSKRYYTEHLIFALYNHSFIFVLVTVLFLLELSATLMANMGWISKDGWLYLLLDQQSLILLVWMPLYFWLGLKRFYRQGWMITSVKLVGIGIVYTALLATLTAFVAVLSFLLL